MRMLFAALALTVASPAALQADPGHAGHADPAAKKTQANAKAKTHPAGCHMMNGKSVIMKGGKMVPCPSGQAKGKAAADPHAGHDMPKK